MLLILVGYRATGKTSIAAELAVRLGVPAADSDFLIVEQAKKSIADIFEQDGEPAFRQMEERIIGMILESDASKTSVPNPFSSRSSENKKITKILSTGGGAPVRELTRKRLKQQKYVVWLSASPETILTRMSKDVKTKGSRPSLTSLPPMEEIESVLKARTPIYRDVAKLTIETDGKSVVEIADEILNAFHLS